MYVCRLPYVEAMILELLRHRTLAAIVPRQTSRDTEVGGYFIPGGTTTCWNSLPDTVDFSSFISFKRTVKQVNLTQFLRIQVCN